LVSQRSDNGNRWRFCYRWCEEEYSRMCWLGAQAAGNCM
jgi:hypothetical protein